MKDKERLALGWASGQALWVVLAFSSIVAPAAPAQVASPGYKAVYGANQSITSSSAFVDASVISGSNICEKIYNALQANPTVPQVVDARGVTTPASCPAGETPWLKASVNLVAHSTILLPPGAISINSPWIMPDGSRLIGQPSGSSDNKGTVLQAGPNFPQAPDAMIEMGYQNKPTGYSTPPCPGSSFTCHNISIEDLTLDGDGQQINGIANTSSQDSSYVGHVRLYQLLGTGLVVSTNAQNSGPYSNITFDTGGTGPTALTMCAQVIGLSGTRGIHGLTCVSTSNSSTAAVSLDSSNNSISDVLIEGFDDGIRVGYSGDAHSNVLSNILGDTTVVTGTQAPANISVIHISSRNHVTDLSVVGIRNTGGGTTLTINDELTTTQLTDPTVSIYALGEHGGVGYSRFTTSPNAATWSVGNGPPTSGCSTTSNLGSLYSSTNTTNGALFVCENFNPIGWIKVK